MVPFTTMMYASRNTVWQSLSTTILRCVEWDGRQTESTSQVEPMTIWSASGMPRTLKSHTRFWEDTRPLWRWVPDWPHLQSGGVTETGVGWWFEVFCSRELWVQVIHSLFLLFLIGCGVVSLAVWHAGNRRGHQRQMHQDMEHLQWTMS